MVVCSNPLKGCCFKGGAVAKEFLFTSTLSYNFLEQGSAIFDQLKGE
jgi:hypothetical protein